MTLEDKFTIVGISPPFYRADYAHPGIPSIVGAVKSQFTEEEVGIVQRDIGAWVLTGYFLDPAILANMSNNLVKVPNLQHHSSIDQVIAKVEETVNQLRNPPKILTPESFSRYLDAKHVLTDVANIVSASSPDEEITIERNTWRYATAGREVLGAEPKTREWLKALAENPEVSIFYNFIAQKAVPYILDQNPDLVGLTIHDVMQWGPAAILSSLIKQQRPDTKVVWGGNVLTRAIEGFMVNDPLNQYLFGNVFDYLIHHEGQKAFVELVEALKENTNSPNLEKIGKLIYMEDGKVVASKLFPVTDRPQYGFPDFSNLKELGDHLGDTTTIKLNEGCASSCSFCAIPNASDQGVKFFGNSVGLELGIEGAKNRNYSIDDFVGWVFNQPTEDGFQHLFISDEQLIGSQFRNLVDVLYDRLEQEKVKTGKRRNLRIEAYTRFQKGLFDDPDFLKKCYEAGFRNLQIGVEAASPSARHFGNKGTETLDMTSQLENIANAGIGIHAFILYGGLPGEKVSDALFTLLYLEMVKDLITTVSVTDYKASRFSPDTSSTLNIPSGIIIDKEVARDLDPNLPSYPLNRNYGGRYSNKIAQALVALTEYWVRTRHDVNRVTRHILQPHRQRYEVNDMKQVAGNLEPDDLTPTEDERKALRIVYNAVVRELGFDPVKRDYEKKIEDAEQDYHSVMRARKAFEKGRSRSDYLKQEVSRGVRSDAGLKAWPDRGSPNEIDESLSVAELRSHEHLTNLYSKRRDGFNSITDVLEFTKRLHGVSTLDDIRMMVYQSPENYKIKRM